MKNLALIALNAIIPASVIIPVGASWGYFKNKLSLSDAYAKSFYLVSHGSKICDEIKNNEDLKSWCMQEQKIGAGST